MGQGPFPTENGELSKEGQSNRRKPAMFGHLVFVVIRWNIPLDVLSAQNREPDQSVLDLLLKTRHVLSAQTPSV